MPAPIILGDTSGLAQGISTAGSALAAGLMRGQEKKYAEQQATEKKQKQQTILGQTLGSLPENASTSDIYSALNTAVSQLDPETAKTVVSMYTPMLKSNMKTEGDAQILRQLGLLPPEEALPIAQEFTPGGQGQEGQPMVGQPKTPGQPQIPGQQPVPQKPQDQVVPQVSSNPISMWTDDQLVMAAASGVPAVAKVAEAEQRRRDLDFKKDSSERDYHGKFATKIVEKETGMRQKLRDKELASVMARDSIESDDVGSFSLSNLGRRLGIRELETTSGAQLNQAAKINLVGNLSDVSAKAQNIWLEKVMSDAFAQVGKSKDANLMTMELFDTEKDLNKAWLDTSDRIKNEDRERYGHVKWESLDERVSNAVVEEEKEIMNRAAFRTRQIFEDSKGERWLIKNVTKKVPKGTPWTPMMARAFKLKYGDNAAIVIENAKKMGYSIPTRQEKDRWER